MKPSRRHSESVRGTRFSVRNTLLLVVLISLLLIAFSSYQDTARSRTIAEHDALRYSREVAIRIDGFVRSTRQMLLGASLSPNLRRQEAEEATSLLGGLLKSNPDYANVWATRADGWNYANPLPSPEGKPIFIGDRQYFKDAMDGKTGVETIQDSRQRANMFAVVISMPVRGDDGNINGTVQAGLVLLPIAEILTNANLPSGSSVTLVDSTGYVLARHPAAGAAAGDRVDGSPLWQTMLADESGVSEAKLEEGSSALSAFTATSLAPWRVVVSYPSEAIYRDVVQSALRLFLLLALPVLAVVYLASRLGNLAVERAQAGDIIRLQEQFLSALIEHSPVGIAVLEGPEHRFRLANPAYRAIPGAAETSIVGRTVAEVFPSLPADALAPLDEASAAGQTVSVREFKVDIGPGREDTYWNVETVPLPGLEGQARQHLILAQEVTEQVRARVETERLLERVQESESLYRSLFTSMSEAFVLVRVIRNDAGAPRDFVFLDANPAYVKRTGHSRRELIGLKMSSLFPDSVPFWLEMAERVFGSGKPAHLERYSRRFDSWIDVVAYSLGEDLIAALMEDITERRRAEEALRESELRLQRAQEIAHLGSWELDMVRDQLTWSDEVYRIFGLGPQEFGATYEAFLDYVHPDDRAAVNDAYAGSLRDNLDSYEIEHRVVRRSTGEVRFVHEKCEHFRDASGKIIRSVGMVHDITDRKHAEAEREWLLKSEQEARSLAETAVKVRDEFMSIAAHELKTPVTSLQGFAQLTLRELGKTGSVSPERLVRSMERIEQQAKRLTRLTEQLLNLSRLQSGKLALSREETHLVSLAERVIVDMQHPYPGRSVELRNGVAGPVLLDPLRIEQVLVNLIDNALKFSPPDSSVDVELSEGEPGWVEVIVRDHGPGIPAQKRARIFERFYQAHPERHAGGMGIGLFVSREIVEMHGGTISVEEPEDGGTRFVVRLPKSEG